MRPGVINQATAGAGIPGLLFLQISVALGRKSLTPLPRAAYNPRQQRVRTRACPPKRIQARRSGCEQDLLSENQGPEELESWSPNVRL